MKVIIPKENLEIAFTDGSGLRFKFKKKSSYIMSDIVAHQLKIIFQKKGHDFNRYFRLLDVNEYYEKFNIKNPKKKIVIIRTGGIGDLISLSSITCFLYENVSKNITWITSPKYPEIFNWYKVPVKGLTFFDAVEKNIDLLKLKKGNRFTGVVYFEGVIENSKENWYELQYEVIGMEKEGFNPEWGRPQLKIPKEFEKKHTGNIDLSKKSILINPRSTSRIRTMPFSDIYEAIIEVIKDNPNYNIYVHEYNIVSKLDKEKLKEIQEKDPRVKLIKAKNLHEFFLDAKDATYTISVDTALIHFREGIEKPGLGIYAAFPTEARTKYYKYTLSIDIPFEKCGQQPCFIHTKRPMEHCEFARVRFYNKQMTEDEYAYAPCIFSKYNEKLIENLIKGVESLLS